MKITCLANKTVVQVRIKLVMPPSIPQVTVRALYKESHTGVSWADDGGILIYHIFLRKSQPLTFVSYNTLSTG